MKFKFVSKAQSQDNKDARAAMYARIEEEQKAHGDKWGETHEVGSQWMIILQAKIGEVAVAILEERHEDVEPSLMQCAGALTAWLEQIIKSSDSE